MKNIRPETIRKFHWLKFAIAFVIVLGVFFWIITHPAKNPDPNFYYFRGTITEVDLSNNHCFGIYFVQLDTVHIVVVDSTYFIPDDEEYPVFRHRGKWGEVYADACKDDNEPSLVGDQIFVDPTDSLIKVVNKKGEVINESDMSPITEPANLTYIKKHTKLSIPSVHQKRHTYRTG